MRGTAKVPAKLLGAVAAVGMLLMRCSGRMRRLTRANRGSSGGGCDHCSSALLMTYTTTESTIQFCQARLGNTHLVRWPQTLLPSERERERERENLCWAVNPRPLRPHPPRIYRRLLKPFKDRLLAPQSASARQSTPHSPASTHLPSPPSPSHHHHHCRYLSIFCLHSCIFTLLERSSC